MSDKSKSFKPVARPSPAEVMQTARDTGALDAALPTVSAAQAAQGAGEGQGAPLPALRQPVAPATPPSPPAAPEPPPVVSRPAAPAQPPAQPAAIAKAPAAANANASDDDEQVQLNLRISKKLDRLLREQGRKYGSKKLALCLALQRGGLDVPAIDLENRSSRRDD